MYPRAPNSLRQQKLDCTKHTVLCPDESLRRAERYKSRLVALRERLDALGLSIASPVCLKAVHMSSATPIGLVERDEDVIRIRNDCAYIVRRDFEGNNKDDEHVWVLNIFRCLHFFPRTQGGQISLSAVLSRPRAVGVHVGILIF